jgi:hypothetical protein
MPPKDISKFGFCSPLPRVVDPLQEALRMTEPQHKRRRHVPESDDEEDDCVPESPQDEVLVEATQTQDDDQDDGLRVPGHRLVRSPFEQDFTDSDGESCEEYPVDLADLSHAELISIIVGDVDPRLRSPLGFIWRPEDQGVDDLGPNPYKGSHEIFDDPDTCVDPKKGSRRWVFTINRPSKLETKALIEFLEQKTHYALFECEIGESGTSHLQGYFHMKEAKTRSACKKLPCFKRAYLAIARGTEGQCQKYCSKDGLEMVFHQANFAPGAGARMDLKKQAAAIRDQGSSAIIGLAMEDPMAYVRYSTGWHRLATLIDRPRLLARPPQVTVVIGESGTGKSTLVRRLCAEAVQSKAAAGTPSGVYDWNHSNYPWFPKVEAETIFMCNDFRPINSKKVQIPMVLFCKMWDQDACKVEDKGITAHAMWDTFFLSCIVHPKDWYDDDPREPIKQLLRRITRVVETYIDETVDGDDKFKFREIGNGLAPYGAPLFVMP